MKFANETIGGGVEILASKDFQAIPQVLAVPGSGSKVVMAGTPIDADGATTTGLGAIGILLYDVDTEANPNGALVVQGIVDATKAQAHSGVSYVMANLTAALPGVIFRTNIGVQGATGATGETGETGET